MSPGTCWHVCWLSYYILFLHMKLEMSGALGAEANEKEARHLDSAWSTWTLSQKKKNNKIKNPHLEIRLSGGGVNA